MKLTENIHALKIPFKITLSPTQTAERFVYVYIITGEKISLIDTGVAGSKKIIFDYIESIGKNPKDIENIFLTHSHPDHIGSAKSIKQETGCKIYIHGAEKDWAQDVDLQYRERPVPGFHNFVEGSIQIDFLLSGGDEINLGGSLSLKAFHTPGHSQGSVSYLLKQDNALFCGDAVLASGQMPVFENFAECVSSVKKLSEIKGLKLLLSSWDNPYEEKLIASIFKDSFDYMHKIEKAVNSISSGDKKDPMEICKKTISILNLPALMVNPVTARSFKYFVKNIL